MGRRLRISRCGQVDSTASEREIVFVSVNLEEKPLKNAQTRSFGVDSWAEGRPASGTEKPHLELGRALMTVKKAVKTAILRASSAEKCQKLAREWSGAGSNRRHRPFQGRALPTELPDLGTSTLVF